MDSDDNYKFLHSLKDNQKRRKFKSFYLSETFILTFVVVIISIICTAGICVAYYNSRLDKIYYENKKLSEIKTVMNLISDGYYKDISQEQLIDAAINGMTSILDANTTYFNQDESSTFNTLISGSYEGIGIQIQGDNGVTIVSVFEDSPADKAGIKVGDILTELNGVDVRKYSSSVIADLIKKNYNKDIKIVVKRDNKEIMKTIKVQTVVLKSVEYKVIKSDEKKIGYIGISLFANNTYGQFKDALKSLQEEKVSGLIIDVRGNSGGYLSVATSILEIMLPKNAVMYQLQTKTETTKKLVTLDEYNKLPVVVLQNELSASASEIISSALKEEGNATIIGTKSFGKGTVQTYYKLSNGTSIKYTIQNWLTSTGNKIDGVGIEPDIKVELSKKYISNPTEENDNQLQEAIKVLKK